jgi:hypothetical protein
LVDVVAVDFLVEGSKHQTEVHTICQARTFRVNQELIKEILHFLRSRVVRLQGRFFIILLKIIIVVVLRTCRLHNQLGNDPVSEVAGFCFLSEELFLELICQLHILLADLFLFELDCFGVGFFLLLTQLFIC